jgi:apolipoprotein D and lipocalin family protein
MVGMKPTGLLVPGLAVLLIGCGTTSHSPLPTAGNVDLKRYAGRWYEVARLPTPFQRADEGATADYTLQPDGTVRVVNTANAPNGRNRSIEGRAEVVPGSNNGRLRVKFTGLAALAPVADEGNYWIIAVDRDRYRHAMVGTPDRESLWLLSRTPKLDPAIQKQLVARAKELGFPVEKLIDSGR